MDKRHVIFLGAGASVNSGYPIGEKLRLRLCSHEHFGKDLAASLETSTLGIDEKEKCKRMCFEHFNEFQEEIQLFRYGGFATVDEFSKLVSAKAPHQAENMKRLMRLAFSFHNPEDKFDGSDYYPFLQRLFEDDLINLRKTITVISYNYDCYLDHLLLRAYQLRRYGFDGKIHTDDVRAMLTSGFFDPTDRGWAQIERFRYLKLHGSIATPRDGLWSYEALFDPDIRKRFPNPAEATRNPLCHP